MRRPHRLEWALAVLPVGAAFAVAAAAAWGQGVHRAALPPPVLQSWKCTGAQTKLFNSWNTVGVSNGATAPSFTTNGRNYCVDSVTAYHWNNGQGAKPGTLGLRVVQGLGGAGHLFGPWLATGSAGQGGAPNVDWTATAPAGQTVINGTYTCQDSDPKTWSQNQASKGHGFCAVYVKNAVKITPPPPPPPTFQCTGPQLLVFEGFNTSGVVNGGTPPTFSTKGATYCLEVLTSYHWNNGAGKVPGTLGLVVVKGLGGAAGTTLGPWQATGSAGQGGAQNVGWGAAPPKLPLFINGTYTCVDSDNATWSSNQASHGQGFCRVWGQVAVLSIGGAPLPAPAPAPAPAGGGHPTCTPTAPSSYLISPGHAAPGGTVSFLLWCQRPVSLGFQGAFAPLGVLIYDEASFNNQRFVNGYLQPISASFPVRPPIVPSYRVVGPNDIDVVLPASMLPGTYIPVVVYAHGEVPSMNGLTVP